MIAIVDYDFSSAKRGLPPPSLAAMKTSAYLKTEQDDMVYLITDISGLANYNEVYFFSDKPIEELPKEIFLLNNIYLYYISQTLNFNRCIASVFCNWRKVGQPQGSKKLYADRLGIWKN